MISSSKLKRIKDRENEKAAREKCLMSLKQSALPVFDLQSRTNPSKCNFCSSAQDKETYGITHEWLLEPVDMLKNSKKLYLIRKILSSIMSALIVHPAQLQVIKYLQDTKPNHSIMLIMDSFNVDLGQAIVKFIMENFNLKVPVSIVASTNEDDMMKILSQKPSILLTDESHMLKIMNVTNFKETPEIYWLPISIGFENFDSVPFKFSVPSYVARKIKNGYGIVKVSFHEPYTYQDFFQRRNFNADFIHNHLNHDIVFKAPVMATNLVSFLLLTYFKKNGGKIEQFVEMADEVQKIFCTVDFAFEGDTVDVVNYALKILQNKITVNEEGLIMAKDDAIAELREFSKVLLYHHALKSVLLSYLDHVTDYNQIDYYKMIDYAVKVITTLKVPFRECISLEDQLTEAFDNLAINELLKRPITIYTENEQRAQKMAKYLDDEDEYEHSYYDDEEEFDPHNQVIINTDKQNEINVLKDMILLIQENHDVE